VLLAVVPISQSFGSAMQKEWLASAIVVLLLAGQIVHLLLDGSAYVPFEQYS